MYLNTETLAQCTERDIRAAFPNTSFAEPFSPPYGYVWVFPAPQPAYDAITQAVRETAPVLTDKGHWEQQWEVVDLDAETIAANAEAAHKARVPTTLTIRQARRVLLAHNLLDTVEAAVAQADRATQIDWEFATEVKRDWPALQAITASLGMKPEQLDALFIEGAKL